VSNGNYALLSDITPNDLNFAYLITQIEGQNITKVMDIATLHVYNSRKPRD
jgi:hypothetical protein